MAGSRQARANCRVAHYKAHQDPCRVRVQFPPDRHPDHSGAGTPVSAAPDSQLGEERALARSLSPCPEERLSGIARPVPSRSPSGASVLAPASPHEMPARLGSQPIRTVNSRSAHCQTHSLLTTALVGRYCVAGARTRRSTAFRRGWHGPSKSLDAHRLSLTTLRQ